MTPPHTTGGYATSPYERVDTLHLPMNGWIRDISYGEGCGFAKRAKCPLPLTDRDPMERLRGPAASTRYGTEHLGIREARRRHIGHIHRKDLCV